MPGLNVVFENIDVIESERISHEIVENKLVIN